MKAVYLAGMAISCVLAPFHRAAAQAPAPAGQSPTLTAADWRADLAFLVSELPKRHKNAYHTISDSAFHAAAARLDARIPTLPRYQIVVELAHLCALISDSHTGLPLGQPSADLHRYPVRLGWFTDGIFIAASDSAHRNLLGARI